jgi:hypothetical protein
MRTFSLSAEERSLSAEERKVRMDLNRKKALDEKFNTPLEAKTDALKLKELTARFPFAKFYVTDTEKDLYYRVEFNHAGVDWMPEMLWYKDYYTSYPFYYFPRSSKIEITLSSGEKKDITYLFE